MSTKLKANFLVEYKYGAFYTGGKVEVSSDGEYLLCQCGCQIQIVQVSNGKVDRTIGQGEDEEVTCFALSPDDQVLVVACRSLQLKQWDWKQNVATRTWRAIHNGPVSCMAFDSTSTLLATGGSDATVKVWDIIRQYCTHNLRGHQGVVSVAKFHPDTSRLQLFTAADDYKIRVWDLKLSSCLFVLESHFSVITALQISTDGNTLFSGGRDKVVTVWSLDTFEKKKTIPVYETLEGLVLLPSGFASSSMNVKDAFLHFVTGGDKGILRVWNSGTGQCVYRQEGPELVEQSPDTEGSDASVPPGQTITSLLHSSSKEMLLSITYDHNIVFHNQTDLSTQKQLVGNMEEILDMKFLGEEDSHLVVASNSELIKVFDLHTWDCQVLRGHTDVIVSVDVNKPGNLIVTGSKDNSMRLWKMDPVNHEIKCVAVGHGHTHTVSTVALSRLQQEFLVSASEDCTLKYWPLPSNLAGNDVTRLTSQVTERAHDKEINAVVIAPNDKLIATGSQDKTAKLWNVANLSLLGVFRGHRRGVWCIQFSPVDQCLATGSGDGTIKLWTLNDFSCIKTFEGHDSLILKVEFLSRGMQLVSSGSDGLVKLWTIKNNECVRTLDEHEEKIWALATSHNEERLATGAADSTLILWKDVTQIELDEAREKEEEFILKEQILSNFLKEKKYLKAIGLAITLDQPFKVLSIMKEILSVPTGREDLDKTVGRLRMDQLDAVLRFASHWNTNAKHCHVSQALLSILLKSKSPEELAALPNYKSSLEGLLPYTERHMARMNRLLQQAMFVDYTWKSMRLVSGPRSSVETVLPSIKAEDIPSGMYRTDRIGNVSQGLPVELPDVVETMETESDGKSDTSDQDSDVASDSTPDKTQDKDVPDSPSETSESDNNVLQEPEPVITKSHRHESLTQKVIGVNGHSASSRNKRGKHKELSGKMTKKSRISHSNSKHVMQIKKTPRKGSSSKLKSTGVKRKRRKANKK